MRVKEKGQVSEDVAELAKMLWCFSCRLRYWVKSGDLSAQKLEEELNALIEGLEIFAFLED